MTRPTRLLDSSKNSAARELLAAGLADNPRRGARERVALGLGLGAGVLASITSSTAGAAVSAAAPSVLAIVGQWLGVGALSGLALAGGASYLASAPATPVASAKVAEFRAVPVSARKSAQADARVPTAPGTDSARSPSDAATATPNEESSAANVPRAASRSAPAASNAPASGRLGREVALIDGARQALSDGNAGQALAALDTYGALDRTETLDREAQILRIEALDVKGERERAVSLAQAYLQTYPSDPHAPRLRTLIAVAARKNH